MLSILPKKNIKGPGSNTSLLSILEASLSEDEFKSKSKKGNSTSQPVPRVCFSFQDKDALQSSNLLDRRSMKFKPELLNSLDQDEPRREKLESLDSSYFKNGYRNSIRKRALIYQADSDSSSHLFGSVPSFENTDTNTIPHSSNSSNEGQPMNIIRSPLRKKRQTIYSRLFDQQVNKLMTMGSVKNKKSKQKHCQNPIQSVSKPVQPILVLSFLNRRNLTQISSVQLQEKRSSNGIH